MRRVAVLGCAADLTPTGDGRNDAELLAPVVDRALAASGLSRDDVGVVCSAGSELVNGIVGSMMDSFDAVPCWPPRTHSHLEGEGAFALYEAWVRLLAGEADAALVCAYSRPLATDPTGMLRLQLDPYVVNPLAPSPHHVAALQARALLDAGRYDEQDLARVVSAGRGGMSVEEVLAQPYVAPPLRAGDCSSPCAGAAAVVLAADDIAVRAVARPAWVTGIDQRVESGALGFRDLTRSVSVEESARRLGLTGSSIDLLEVHAPYSHQGLLVVDAIGAASVGAMNSSGGVLAGDAPMVSGLIRIVAAAEAVLRGEARRAVAHATNGPCLQHNLLCLLESDR